MKWNIVEEDIFIAVSNRLKAKKNILNVTTNVEIMDIKENNFLIINNYTANFYVKLNLY